MDEVKETTPVSEPTPEATSTPEPVATPEMPKDTAPVATEPVVQAAKTSNSMMMIVIVLIIVLLIAGAGAVYFLLVKKDSKDSSASQSSTSQTNNDNNSGSTGTTTTPSTPSADVKTYDGTAYSFDYPKAWYLDTTKSTNIFVYYKNPTTLTAGQLNDNVNVGSAGILAAKDMSNSDCEDFANQVITQIKNNPSYGFDAVTLSESSVDSISSVNVCRIKFSSTYKGVSLVQTEYVFLNPDTAKESYIVALTTYAGSKNSGELISIAESFKIK